jgi:hypothetical protein
MRRREVWKKLRVVGLLTATTTVMAFSTLGSSIPKAGADPAWQSSYVGVGSDTIQDVFDA